MKLILLSGSLFLILTQSVCAQLNSIENLESCFKKLELIRELNKSTVWPSYTCSSLPSRIAASGAAGNGATGNEQSFVAEADVEVAKLNQLPVLIENEALLFSADRNPVTNVISLGCITGEVEIVEKCYPSFVEELKSGKVTLEQLRTRVPYRFDIKEKSSDSLNQRKFEFHHENFAKQDTGMSVWEGNHNASGRDSHKVTEMVFIPRSQVPSYSIKNSDLEVTLANGEKILFDANSGKIKGGVLSSTSYKAGQFGEFKYSGKNIMIQARGTSGSSKSHMETAKTAQIVKDGKVCEVSFDKLWTRPKEAAAPHFKFSNDEEFYQWLNNQSNCFKK